MGHYKIIAFIFTRCCLALSLPLHCHNCLASAVAVVADAAA